jgi:hypothetical protein
MVMQLWYGQGLYVSESQTPMGSDAWRRSFVEAFQSAGSGGFKFSVTSVDGQVELTWRRRGTEHDKHECSLLEVTGSDRKAVEQAFEEGVQGLCFHEEPQPVSSAALPQLPQQWTKGAEEQQALLMSCTKLLQARSQRILTLERQLASGNNADAGSIDSDHAGVTFTYM